MSVLHHTPTTGIADAERIARDLYGIYVTAEELPSERDRAFLLRVSTPIGDGAPQRFVLKVSNSREERALLQAQDSMAVRALSAGLPVQRLHDTTAGDRIGQDGEYLVRLFDYLPGRLLADVVPRSPELLADLGVTTGRLARAMDGFDDPAAHRAWHWDVMQAPATLTERRSAVSDASRQQLIDQVLGRYESTVLPRSAALRRGVIHGDAHMDNVLVDEGLPEQPASRFVRVGGLLDFGDIVYSAVVAEPAVAAAYMTLPPPPPHEGVLSAHRSSFSAPLTSQGDVTYPLDPLDAVCAVLAGFDSQFPLTDDELAVAWTLVLGRLALSGVNAAVQGPERPNDPYLVVSEQPAWMALESLLAIDPSRAHYRIRAACGREPHRNAESVRQFLATGAPSPLLGDEWTTLRTFPVDLSVGSPELSIEDLGADAAAMERAIRSTVDGDPDAVGVGGYGEARLLYATEAYAMSPDPASERRTIHLGLDVWTRVGQPLHAPLPSVVEIVHDNDAPQDYGPMVVLRHTTDDGIDFFSLYGHLARETLAHVRPGQHLEAGEVFAWVGDPAVNGGWAPHAHVQVILDLLNLAHDYPGVCAPSQSATWLGLSPDPALLLGIPAAALPASPRPASDTLDDRRRLLAPSLSLSYDPPLRIVRGMGARLYDDRGRSYLDSVNNVAHVGHAHPHVVSAGARQMRVLNTNTRYLHDEVLRYAQRLTELLPEPLSVCFFVNSGSEANDLALRLARAHSGHRDMLCLEHGYHGHTQALIDVSHYKHAGTGGRGAPPEVHVATMPDAYRGAFRGYSHETALAYAADVKRCVVEAGGAVAGMIAEPMVGCGGQVVLPDNYLAEAAAIVRSAGGIFIADEVQVGFGRVGPKFWGFATQSVVPDVVTVGKPAGNGHPLAAVITTAEIADSFANGMEYFNTFGGNPVSAAIGNAVLDVIVEEDLAVNAELMGGRIIEGVRALAEHHELIGDVRGLGLYLGVELVRDRATLEPADAEAAFVIERMKRLGVLVSTDGPHHNVLKIKPPLVWDEGDVDRLVATLDRVLREPALQR